VKAREEHKSKPTAAEIVPALLTTKQAAALASVGERTWWRWTRCGIAPPPVKIGGAVRYRRDEVLQWIADGCPRCDKQKKGITR
jgi:predicted DNA-binding transcriptional regulator AlpA